jgi:hypothetical protein
MSRRLDALAPFSARIRSLVHVVTNTCNRSLFFAPKLREPHNHINFQGRYSFALAEAVARGELRPLRDRDEDE